MQQQSSQMLQKVPLWACLRHSEQIQGRILQAMAVNSSRRESEF